MTQDPLDGFDITVYGSLVLSSGGAPTPRHVDIYGSLWLYADTVPAGNVTVRGSGSLSMTGDLTVGADKFLILNSTNLSGAGPIKTTGTGASTSLSAAAFQA
jgi:hypothetical protein